MLEETQVLNIQESPMLLTLPVYLHIVYPESQFKGKNLQK